MTLNSLWKVRRLALAAAGLLVMLLLVRSSKPELLTPDLRIAGLPQTTNGVTLISFVLSNGTSRTLNIVDDGIGNAFVVLDAGAGSNVPGTIGIGVNTLSNTLKLNLAPGTALTNTVRLTNPPARFRLLVEARELRSERRRAFVELLRSVAVKATLSQPAPRSLVLLAASPWIENGSPSNRVQTATGRVEETQPTD